MPTPPAVPAVLRFHLKHSYGSDVDVLPRWYMQYSGTAPTVAQLATLALAVGTQWNTSLAALHNGQVTITECEIEDLTSATAASANGSFSHSGTRTGGLLPAATCVVLGFEIARRYRGGKPRIYLPAGSDTDVNTPQTWNATFIANVISGWQGFMSGVSGAVWSGGGGLAQVNVSFYFGFTAVENPVTKRYRNVPTYRSSPIIDSVTGIAGNTIIGSQRRRNKGGG